MNWIIGVMGFFVVFRLALIVHWYNDDEAEELDDWNPRTSCRIRQAKRRDTLEAGVGHARPEGPRGYLLLQSAEMRW